MTNVHYFGETVEVKRFMLEDISNLVGYTGGDDAFQGLMEAVSDYKSKNVERWEQQWSRIAALETALRACIARAGNPDPAEGCRQVIRTAQDALEGKEGES